MPLGHPPWSPPAGGGGDERAPVRRRNVDPVALFWTVVLGFGAGRTRSFAGLRRSYERAAGQCLEESSFYMRFNEGPVRMLQGALVHAL